MKNENKAFYLIWFCFLATSSSRIPGHWVQPPPPANEIWASYLVRPKWLLVNKSTVLHKDVMVSFEGLNYVPNMESNLLSLGQLLEKGFSMHMEGEHMKVADSNWKCVLKIDVSKNRTFKVGVSTIKQKCLTAQSNDSVWKWHRRLGHLNFNSLNKLQLASPNPSL